MTTQTPAQIREQELDARLTAALLKLGEAQEIIRQLVRMGNETYITRNDTRVKIARKFLEKVEVQS